jgi:CheY-like chemotaxis protein
VLALQPAMTRSSGDVDKPIVVAIVNTNPDVVRRLRIALEQVGFVVLVVHVEEMKLGVADVDTLLNQHDPRVIVYDVAPPYEQNWRFLDHLRANTGFKGRQFVLTSVNLKRLNDVVAKEESVYEVAGESTDIEQIVRAVKEASRARPVR